MRHRGARAGLSRSALGSGCRGPGAGGFPALSWPRLDHKPDSAEGGGRVLDPPARTACCSALSSLLDFLFVCSFVFFFLKKKKEKRKKVVSLGSVCGSCYAARGRGGQTERAPAAAPEWRLLGERRIVRGSGWGAGAWAPLPSPCLFSQNRRLLLPAAGREGAPGEPLGSAQVCAPSLPQRIKRFALWPYLSPGARNPD